MKASLVIITTTLTDRDTPLLRNLSKRVQQSILQQSRYVSTRHSYNGREMSIAPVKYRARSFIFNFLCLSGGGSTFFMKISHLPKMISKCLLLFDCCV
jgi:hypothetical protein